MEDSYEKSAVVRSLKYLEYKCAASLCKTIYNRQTPKDYDLIEYAYNIDLDHFTVS